MDGETKALPLQRTDVFAELSTQVATVDVIQTYKNEFTAHRRHLCLPLPENAAVDDLKDRGRRPGDRGRDPEARRRPQDLRARRAGNTAALLEQERPNIFTQSVANIPAGEGEDAVRFVQQLTYDGGEVEWAFPWWSAPLHPRRGHRRRRHRWAADTDQVPDASRITPPIVGEGLRPGPTSAWRCSSTRRCPSPICARPPTRSTPGRRRTACCT
ncbi:MAG: VIT domain-containing protein [bacterium]